VAILQIFLLGIVVILVLGSTIIWLKRQLSPSELDHELSLRMRSWWVMAGAVVIACAIGPIACIVLFAGLSFLAIKEYCNVVNIGIKKHVLNLLFVLVIGLQYGIVYLGKFNQFIWLLPMLLLLGLPILAMVLNGFQQFIQIVTRFQWGVLLTVFLLSHAVAITQLPFTKTAMAGSVGWLLFLLFLTQFNDVLQFLWGKGLGKTRIVPTVSPSKTLEGLLGGLCTTVGLAWLIAPYLTTLTTKEALLAGGLIALSGFWGDVTFSAIKRDLGIKDMSQLIPGHGGILDRIDSLIFSAPMFYYFVLMTQ
jgi:phosphatidate cytidylyltransferase